MLDLPSQNDVDNFRKIPIMVAPAGIKVIEFDPENQKLIMKMKDGYRSMSESHQQEHIH